MSRMLLIVEDDLGLQSQLRWCFEGYEVALATNREEALAAMHRFTPPVVTLDLGLPPHPGGASEGLKALDQILHVAPQTKVIVITGNDDRANAVRAVGAGAYDFYQKPVEAQILRLIVDRAYWLYELEQENRRLLQEQSHSPLSGIVAASASMLKVCRTVEKLAPTGVTTLLLGESGTGKEVLARALHALSPRAAGRFVAINCAAIPESLLESELFGYEKGAFTGAGHQLRGKVEYAEGGTLFLDEIGDLPLALQAKLLRFLQERVIERVGGRAEIRVDVRVVAATHTDLTILLQQRKFREDLYYRLSEVSVRIPPVRERESDVLLLARVFLDRFAAQQGRLLKGFTPEALSAIAGYGWPGNVREIENRVKRAVVMAEGPRVSAEDLELIPQEVPMELNLRQVREAAERQAVQRALQLYPGNLSQVAERLGISRPTLYDLLNKYGMK